MLTTSLAWFRLPLFVPFKETKPCVGPSTKSDVVRLRASPVRNRQWNDKSSRQHISKLLWFSSYAARLLTNLKVNGGTRLGISMRLQTLNNFQAWGIALRVHGWWKCRAESPSPTVSKDSPVPHILRTQRYIQLSKSDLSLQASIYGSNLRSAK